MSDAQYGPVSTAVGNLGDDATPARIVVAATIVEQAPVTSAEIERASGLSVATITDAVQELADAGLIESRPRPTERRGRNPTEYYPVGGWVNGVLSSAVDTTARVPVAIDDVPPSAKLVAFSLVANGEQTQKQLVETTNLSQRTVRDGLESLDEHIVERPKMTDARQSIYDLEVSSDA